MGARTNICIHYEGGQQICCYARWGGEGMHDDLRNALVRGKPRWDDPGYLARIIFCELVKDDVLGLTGFGIQPEPGEEEYKTLEVDLEKQTVNGQSYEGFIHA